MHISEIKLRGFRNFKNAKIVFAKKTLIIGSNDIGKSNLLYAIRLLLDKSLSEYDLEPKDSDFYVHEATNEIFIQIKFEDVKQDCVISKLRENISDEGVLYLAYKGTRDSTTKKKTYSILAGRDEDSIRDLQGRFYLKVLNAKYISSSRSLATYLKREKRFLLEEAKSTRDENQITADETALSSIEKSLNHVSSEVAALSYIKKATKSINSELRELSFHHESQEVTFDVGAADPSVFVDNLALVSKVNGESLTIGGDGRNNQIFLALWAARNEVPKSDPLEVVIYCIEEPEAHLHPHQQRKLAKYLATILHSQVIITSHSPQISCEFPPNSIIRLYKQGLESLAAQDGCSDSVKESLIEFGYRLNILPAEAFFSSVALLVEGPSEYLFYKALAPSVGIDLDRLNISILNVEGIGFLPYINLLSNLGIDWVIRTDNDIYKIKGTNLYRFAGIERCINIYDKCCQKYQPLEDTLNSRDLLRGFDSIVPPADRLDFAKKIIQFLEGFDIFIADNDLENDLKNSPIHSYILEFFPNTDEQSGDLVKQMQKRKASFMFSFLQKYSKQLKLLERSSLSKPLMKCQEIAGAK